LKIGIVRQIPILTIPIIILCYTLLILSIQ